MISSRSKLRAIRTFSTLSVSKRLAPSSVRRRRSRQLGAVLMIVVVMLAVGTTLLLIGLKTCSALEQEIQHRARMQQADQFLQSAGDWVTRSFKADGKLPATTVWSSAVTGLEHAVQIQANLIDGADRSAKSSDKKSMKAIEVHVVYPAASTSAVRRKKVIYVGS